MLTAFKIAVGLLGGGGAVDWFLDINFNTDDAAPITSPYPGEIGQLTAAQGSGNFGAASGEMSFPAGVDPGTNSNIYDATARTPTGAAFFSRIKWTDVNIGTVSGFVGLFSSATLAYTNAILVLGAGIATVPSQFSIIPGFLASLAAIVDGTYYKTCIVAAPTILYGFADYGSGWELVWTATHAAANIYAGLTTRGGSTGNVDYMKGRYLPAPFSADYGIATFTDTTLASNDTFTATADGEHTFLFTLPGAPAANDEVSMYYRGNDTDGWKAFAKRNAGNTAWDFRVRTVSGGVESTPSGWSDVTGVGSIIGIRVSVSGTAHAFYTITGTTWSKRGANLAVSHQDSATGMKLITAAGTTLTRLTSYPRTSTIYTAELNRGL